MGEFNAKYVGWCGCCETTIGVGDLVRYVDNEIEHVECSSTADITREICPECFLERAVNGSCSCVL